MVGFVLAFTAAGLYVLFAASLALDATRERLGVQRDVEVMEGVGVALRARVRGIDRGRVGAGVAPAAVGALLQGGGLGPGAGAFSGLGAAALVDSMRGELRLGSVGMEGSWEFVARNAADVLSVDGVWVQVRSRAGQLRQTGAQERVIGDRRWAPSARAALGGMLVERHLTERDCAEVVSITGGLAPSPPSSADCDLSAWVYAPAVAAVPAGMGRGIWRAGVALEGMDALGRAGYCPLRSDTAGDCWVDEVALTPADALRRQSRTLVGWTS